ncbi:MAG: alkaline phosphatase [Planctomycetota bacterium]
MTSTSPTNRPSVDRRRFLTAAGATGAALLASNTHAQTQRSTSQTNNRARNVILLVADGMSAGTLQLADRYLRDHGQGPSHWVRLWSRPEVRRAAQMTHSANALVTDSAAAGSAWGSGVHVNNGAINFTPDNQEPTPLLVEAKAHNKATGLVTTTRVTHATPAAFVANVPRRSLEDDIARQMLERNVDLILGGGAKHFPPETIALRPNTDVLHTQAQLRAYAANTTTKPRPVIGLFNNDHMRYEIDRLQQSAAEREPSLEDMTRVALAELDQAPNGFVLQIEGGRVDHAAHANDAAALVQDQVAFDHAIAAVDAFTQGRDDTLVLLTTDHANANPGLTIYGQPGIRCWERLAKATHSFEWITERFAERDKDNTDPLDTFVALVEQAAAVKLTQAERDAIQRGVLDRQPTSPFRPLSQPLPVLGQVLANHFGVAFVSPNHTADYVELTAWGPGSEPVAGLMDNIELHTLMRNALGFPENK